MKLILAGHKGSQKIRKASEYLVNKYMPGFDVYWMNYEGEISGWSEFIARFLRTLNDKYIVFALDDYLLSAPLDQEKFDLLLSNMDDDVVCARLCDSSFYTNIVFDGELIRVGYDDYVCTTQYCIWDREALINILEQVNTPWEFELEGSEFMNRIDYKVIGTQNEALKYNTNSALSNRWEGVDLKGLNEDDTKKVKELIE